MALKKQSITDEQKEMIIGLVSKKVSGREIAKRLKLSQPKVWRFMEKLGINKKKNRCKQIKKPPVKYFSWEQVKKINKIW